jgi:hypothetical protein
MSEYYIGQKFSEMYPQEAATWCNENNAYIKELDPVDDVRQFEIFENEPYVPTYDDIDRMRVNYRKSNIDDRTLARSRKMANGTWTEEDEQAYIALDAEVTAYIESHFPYPSE